MITNAPGSEPRARVVISFRSDTPRQKEMVSMYVMQTAHSGFLVRSVHIPLLSQKSTIL